MDNVTAAPRARAARMRTVVLRLGALLAATISLIAIPAVASADRASSHPDRRTTGHASRRPASISLAGRPTRSLLARWETTRRHRMRRELRALRRERRAVRAARRAHPHRQSSGACPGSGTAIAHAAPSRMRHAVVCLLNRERKRRGLPALSADGRLVHSAQGWTNTMVDHHDFSHGSSFAARITAAGFAWSHVGENIATGYQTPATAVRAWMRSTGHCENILNPMFREVGTGVDAGRTALGPGTWTLDLGLRAHQHADSANWKPAERCPYAG